MEGFNRLLDRKVEQPVFFDSVAVKRRERLKRR